MNQQIHETYEKIFAAYQLNFIHVLEKIITEHATFCQQFQSYQESLTKLIQTDGPYLPQLIQEKQSFYQAIKSRYHDFVSNQNLEFEQLNALIENILLQVPEVVVEEQSNERFVAQPDDSGFLKRLKFIKKQWNAFLNLPKKVFNTFRKLFKRPIHPVKRFSHKIPLRNLTLFYLHARVFASALPLLKELRHLMVIHYHQMISIDNNQSNLIFNKTFIGKKSEAVRGRIAEIDAMVKEMNEFNERLKSQLQTDFQANLAQFKEDYLKVGTIELSPRHFSIRKSKGIIKRSIRRTQKEIKAEDLKAFVLKEDWLLDLEIYMAVFKTELARINFRSNWLQGIESIYQLMQNDLFVAVKSCKSNILKNREPQKINQEKQKVSDNFSAKLIPGILNEIFARNLPQTLDSFSNEVTHIIQDLSSERKIVAKFNFEEILKESDIKTFMLRELVQYSIYPALEDNIEKSKRRLINSLSKLDPELHGIMQIIVFNLESALDLMGANQGKEGYEVATEGIERAVRKTEDLTTLMLDLQNSLDAEIKESVHEYAARIHELEENEDAISIQLKIVKAKAIERTKAYRVISTNWVREKTKRGFNQLKLLSKRVTLGIFKLRKKYGMVESSQPTSKVSDFLAESEALIEQLPFVYQRLFKPEPLNSQEFFEKRAVELKMLNEAYSSWQKQKFAPVVIASEKGFGKTSLINVFLLNLQNKEKVFRYDPQVTIYKTEDFIDFLGSQIKPGKAKPSLQDLVDAFNQGMKKIVVLEDLHQFYLKRVHGFVCLKLLFELIAATHKKVFWILSCSVYAWRYFDKTIQSSDYLGYVIELDQFSVQDLQKLILRRNAVSGFKLYFEIPKRWRNSKKFKNLSESEQQQELQQDYFKSLNRIANGNISIGFIYWLRSVSKIEKDVIFIDTNPVDLSFLSALSLEKVYSLHALLLHETLTENEHQLIFGGSPEKSRLLLIHLFEDGIILRSNGSYKINSILYRQVVNLLNAKNFIH